MSQRAATITSLPAAFEVVKTMQADGLDWSEGFRPLGRQAVAEIIEQQMRQAIDRHLEQFDAEQLTLRRRRQLTPTGLMLLRGMSKEIIGKLNAAAMEALGHLNVLAAAMRCRLRFQKSLCENANQEFSHSLGQVRRCRARLLSVRFALHCGRSAALPRTAAAGHKRS
jgi:hypothetical protein